MSQREQLPFYLPTSLDFINRPNPVEPQSVPEKHPLNCKAQLCTQLALRNPLGQSVDAPNDDTRRRHRASDDKLLDLPKLPIPQGSRMPLIPPTLSGLHQPPPDARLLPSMSTKQPQLQRADTNTKRSERTLPSPPLPAPRPTASAAAAAPPLVPARVRHSQAKQRSACHKSNRNKWSDDETADLLRGVARFGVGNWTKILRCPDYNFSHRTALGLKDRFRVCRPEDYKRSTNERPAKAKKSNGRSERMSHEELRELGIDQPFLRSNRRRRHGYSAMEDDNLLRGFQIYGSSWAAIRADARLGLNHRLPTDLRDRMRTRFPEQYAKRTAHEKQPQGADKAAPGLEDDYLGEAFDYGAGEEPVVTLDRDILDWASADLDRPLSSHDSARVTAPFSGSLPSLADITTGLGSSGQHLELPLLMPVSIESTFTGL